MLKSLKIENLGLVEEAFFSFDSGFTAITGETGSGKTSLLEAIKLSLGKKSDYDFIKMGASKASICAVFDLASGLDVKNKLKEFEIDFEPTEPLLIKRVLYKEGKSKAFINDQAVSLQTLVKISPYLCDFVDQHVLSSLKDPVFFIELIDKTSGLCSILNEYKELYQKTKDLESKLSQLEKDAFQKELKIEFLQEDIKDLEACPMKPGEETAIFEDFKRTQALLGELSSFQKLSDQTNGDLLPLLKKIKSDKHLGKDLYDLLENAYQLVCEFSHKIDSELEDTLLSEQKLAHLETKLKKIVSLKRKFQAEPDEFEKILEMKQQELEKLLNLEFTLEELKIQHASTHKLMAEKAQSLSLSRQKHALNFEKQILKNLRPLNMPYCEIKFHFSHCDYGLHGIDHIDFLLKANSNAELLPLLESASGGEIARVNFCFFLAQSISNPACTYFFDEIDASVGGITSTLMGDKLQVLSKEKQVFCITHFAQMAQKADHHLSFKKLQDESTTWIDIQYCSHSMNFEEIDRMIGVKE